MSDYDTDLLIGIAQHLAAQSLGVWSPAGTYTADQTGIVLDVMPQAPDSVITLSSYPVTDDPSQAVNVTGLQVQNRAAGRDPRAYRTLAALIGIELHGRTHLTLSTGQVVTQILRQSGTSFGQDTNGRWSMVQNFYCNLYVPALNAH